MQLALADFRKLQEELTFDSFAHFCRTCEQELKEAPMVPIMQADDEVPTDKTNNIAEMM